MTRAAGTSVENNFVHGLITEATGMNFPENSAQDTIDCVYHPIGAVTRRPGWTPEDNAVQQTITTDTSAVAEFRWDNVANLGNLTFVVQQVGMTLYFFEVSGGPLSAGLKSGTINLNNYKTSGSPTTSDGEVCQFAFGDGRLFVVHPFCEPFYVDYDFGADTFTVTQITFRIRDFKRQADGLQPDERPSTLSALHKYNLFNQGWFFSGSSSSGGSGGSTAQNYNIVQPSGNASATGGSNMLDYWHSHRSDWPSNADIWWLFKNADDNIDYQNFNKIYFGNSLAPNGHYILNPWATDRGTQTGISGLPEETSGSQRPSSVTFFSGRVWYGGVAATGYGDHIYFTQILENINQAGECYQTNDPTSEQDSDLFPSDGGVIVIPGLGTLLRLYPIGNAIVVLASNGTWMVSGSSGSGFFANDYSVQKVSEHPCAAPMSVVEVEGSLMYWNYNGIFLFQLAPTGAATVKSTTDPTIKTYYQAIPPNNIPFVKGAYNPTDMVVQWLFKTGTANTVSDNFVYDHVLNLRTNTQAFYPWSISSAASVSGAPTVSGLVAIRGAGVSRVDDIVTANGQTVILA